MSLVPFEYMTQGELQKYAEIVRDKRCCCGHFGYQHEFTLSGIISKGQCGCFGDSYCGCGHFRLEFNKAQLETMKDFIYRGVKKSA